MSLSLRSPVLPPPVSAFQANNLFAEEEVKERILIVDDSVVVRRLFVQCLSPQYICEEADSVNGAL